ncbi:hypothetical protein YC2023_036911 [Brassica napus]
MSLPFLKVSTEKWWPLWLSINTMNFNASLLPSQRRMFYNHEPLLLLHFSLLPLRGSSLLSGDFPLKSDDISGDLPLLLHKSCLMMIRPGLDSILEGQR